jgi:hypothetical protein
MSRERRAHPTHHSTASHELQWNRRTGSREARSSMAWGQGCRRVASRSCGRCHAQMFTVARNRPVLRLQPQTVHRVFAISDREAANASTDVSRPSQTAARCSWKCFSSTPFPNSQENWTGTAELDTLSGALLKLAEEAAAAASIAQLGLIGILNCLGVKNHAMSCQSAENLGQPCYSSTHSRLKRIHIRDDKRRC